LSARVPAYTEELELSSSSSSSSSASQHKQRSIHTRWFNLDLPVHSQLRKEVDDQISQQPLGLHSIIHVDISIHSASLSVSPILLERWSLYFDQDAKSSSSSSSSSSSGKQQQRIDPVNMYKRMIVLIRSIYTYVRMLPARKLFKRALAAQAALTGKRSASSAAAAAAAAAEGDSSSSPPSSSSSSWSWSSSSPVSVLSTSQSLPFQLRHSITISSSSASSNAVVFDHSPASFSFTSITTDLGRLHASVFYRQDCQFEFGDEPVPGK
jgi:hypothetical protein